MSSEIGSEKQAERPQFSRTPLMHYVLAICVTAFAKASHFAFQTHECLNNSGWDCSWSGASAIAHDPKAMPDIGSILFLFVFHGLFLALCFLVFEGPAYAFACYMGRRCGIRRNVAGIAFWMGAWILTFLSLAGIGSFFDPRHVPWVVDRNVGSTFAVLGGICGGVYCALAFLHRD
jgi:hypothetical protein